MKQRTFFIAVLIVTLAALPAMAMKGHDSHGAGGEQAMQADKKMDHGKTGEATDPTGMGGAFKHTATQGGIDAEFQVMSLASMNMTSDKGETHHIMVNLKTAESGGAIKQAVGKIKVIAPDKSEQVSALKNYNGILAANFTFNEPGKYGVICLLKHQDEKQVFKFWYDHMQ
ncbi:MAG TPA: hypothetical protein VLT88_11425 [Desulfosarcina sp.]|nr:hypothetical protein [Desulfosarcina sp.]